MRRTACILLLVSLLPTFARAAVRLTPEVAIADPSPAVPQEGINRPDAVATDGTDFLVVWAGPGGLNTGVIAADGALKGLPRQAIERAEQIRNVSLCWTGATYLVTWGEGSSSDDVKVIAATLARDGAMASAPRIVAKPAFTQTGALASNGRRALLAYTRLGTSSLVTVQGALFDAQGALITADVALPITITVSNYADPVPQIASDGNEFALLWRSGEVTPALLHTFRLTRVSEDGTAIGEPITFPQGGQTGAEYGIAFGGGKYAVAAIEQHLRLVRFVVDPRSGVVTQLPSVDSGGWDASVLWNGSQFIGYWMEYSTTFFKLVTVPYDSSTPATVVSGTHIGHQPRLAFNGRNVFGAWSETVGAGEQIRAARFDPSAATRVDVTPSLVSTSWSRQLSPAVATSGHDSLVVWIDERGEGNFGRLLAARVSLTGAVIDRKPIEIGPATLTWVPATVVFTGATYLVVWHEPVPVATIVARTVGRDGSLGPRISLGAGASASVAVASSTTLVVAGTSEGAFGYRFNPAGELLDATPILIAASYGVVATNGTDFLVIWSVGSDYWQFPSPDMIDIVGKRVMASGAVDASPIPIATGRKNQLFRAVASDGRDYLVVYDLLDYDSRALAAKRVLREGQLDGVTATDDGTIITSGTAPSVVAVAGDVTGFWVAWTESSMKLAHTDGRGTPGEIVLVDGQPNGIALAQPAHGLLQLVYTRRVTDGPFPMTSRAFVRFFGEMAGGRGRAARH